MTVDRLLYTAREAAQTLAVSERTLWSLTQSGEIRYVRIGRSVRYDAEDIQAFIDAHKTKSQETCRLAEEV
jgi:excisionase family DNA binding protein